METLEGCILSYAKEFVGQEEIPGNKGFKDKDFDALMRHFTTFKNGHAWCVYFCWLCWQLSYDDFAESFKLADITIVPDIYFVRDSASLKKQINAEVLVERIKANDSQALFIDSFEGICNHLKDNVARGDLVVSMGAGDIWKVADEYIHWLGTNC